MSRSYTPLPASASVACSGTAFAFRDKTCVDSRMKERASISEPSFRNADENSKDTLVVELKMISLPELYLSYVYFTERTESTAHSPS
jgi:hypothetical protein